MEVEFVTDDQSTAAPALVEISNGEAPPLNGH